MQPFHYASSTGGVFGLVVTESHGLGELRVELAGWVSRTS